MRVQSLVPFVPAHLPRAPAVWWCASAEQVDGRLIVDRLEQRECVDPITHRCAIAAPCSLPDAFREWLALDNRALAEWTRSRLLQAARQFAARQRSGHKHPARDIDESQSAMDRRRLTRFHAALPLLVDPAPHQFEFDTLDWLQRANLATQGLHRNDMHAISRRASILLALTRDHQVDVAAGDVAARDFAVASWPALEAVIGCYAAATT